MFDATDYNSMREDRLSQKGSVFLIPREIRSAEKEGTGVLFKVAGRWYRKDLLEPFFTQDDHALLTDGEEEELFLRILPWGNGRIRIRLFTDDPNRRHDTEMVCGTPEPVKFVLEEGKEDWHILTDDLRVVVGKAPYSLRIEDRGGKILFSQYTQDTHSISHIVKGQNPRYEDSFSGFESYPVSLARTGDGKTFWTDAIGLDYDEHFYGFGEQFGPLDKLGQEVLLWQSDALSSSTAKAYKNIPFFMSSKGYGIFINSSAKSRFMMGSYHYKAYQMECHDRELDYFYIHGPSFKRILSSYTDITGKTPRLPDWSFGLWMSKNTYRTQDELLAVARTIREKGIPCDVIHLDVGWFEKDWMCDYEFSKERFPDPEGMCRELEGLGFRLSVWQLPYFKKENRLYAEAAEKGYFALTPDGEVSTKDADGVLDVSNPEAVSWYRRQLKKLFDKGVSVVKTDFGESVEADALYHGYSGGEMHNLYPLLYNRAVYEATVEGGEGLPGEGIIWARSAWAGSQRYPLHWGGDANSDFSGMYTSLRGGLSFGLSGFPFWSHDVGGYYCDVEPEVYIRWAQMGMFSSHMRMHGTTSREPWRFGEEIEQIFLKYARLRYRLLPYILSQAVDSTNSSLPMMRAMVLEFQEDPTTFNIDDQYMFGSDILVAPVMSTAPSRRIYLPAGTDWFDFHTRKRYRGGRWLNYETPLDILPLFIKEGVILPMGDARNHLGEKDFTNIELNVFGPPRGEYHFSIGNEELLLSVKEDKDGKSLLNLPASPHQWQLFLWSDGAVENLNCDECPKGASISLERADYPEEDAR